MELTSPSDRLPAVREKMAEWMANGCRLGWILHPPQRALYVYRGGEVAILEGAVEAKGEGPVEGFTLDITSVWDPGW
jgi:Uma2 family endonuclease